MSKPGELLALTFLVAGLGLGWYWFVPVGLLAVVHFVNACVAAAERRRVLRGSVLDTEAPITTSTPARRFRERP